MALSPTRLSTAIYNAWTGNSASGFSSPLTPAQQAIIKAQCDAIAQSVVTEITTNAQVSTTDIIAVTSVSGVTTGPGVSGPGAGTGTGTGTIS
jgi:hypothetical protein